MEKAERTRIGGRRFQPRQTTRKGAPAAQASSDLPKALHEGVPTCFPYTHPNALKPTDQINMCVWRNTQCQLEMPHYVEACAGPPQSPIHRFTVLLCIFVLIPLHVPHPLSFYSILGATQIESTCHVWARPYAGRLVPNEHSGELMTSI